MRHEPVCSDMEIFQILPGGGVRSVNCLGPDLDPDEGISTLRFFFLMSF